MRFGIHHSSWLDGPDPAGAFDTAKAKAQWAEEHGFTWFSVMDHTIQIPRVGAPDEPVLEGWAVLAGLASVTRRIRLATLATAVNYRNPTHRAISGRRCRPPDPERSTKRSRNPRALRLGGHAAVRLIARCRGSAGRTS